jgi:hypothetical protein
VSAGSTGELTEEQENDAFLLKEGIWVAVHELVDKLTEGRAPIVDEYVRNELTEQFRFWRRQPR